MSLGTPPPGRKTIGWGFGGIGLSLALQAVSGIPLLLLFRGGGRTAGEVADRPGYLAASVLVAGVCGIVAFTLARSSMRWSMPDAGVRRGIGFWASLGIAFGMLIGFGVVSRAWESLVHPPKDTHVVIRALEAHPSFGIVALFALGAGVMAPISEELLFRGLLYRSLTRIGEPLALLISGVVFGALHVGAVPAKLLPLLGFLGILLALLYSLTGSIIPSMCLHAFINATSVGQTTGTTDAGKMGWSISTLIVAWGCIFVLRHRFRDAPLGNEPSPSASARQASLERAPWHLPGS